jgi:hypothetical protein
VILPMLYLFSFPSFPKFHRVVPLLQTCSTSEFVYDHAWFCVYVYLWNYLPHMTEKCMFCVSDPGLLQLTWCPPGAVSLDQMAVLEISSFLRNLHTAFRCGCTNFHSHQQCISIPVFPNPHQHLLLLLLWIMAILTWDEI